MPFFVLAPPASGEDFAKLGKEIYAAAHELGITIDAEGFMQVWIKGTRVLAERDSEGKIVGLMFVAAGKSWVHSDFTATVLGWKGSDELLEFARQICRALGSTVMIRELGPLTETTIEVLREPL